MPGIDRKPALCAQTRFTGIDFVQVVDPAAQDLLRVFFVVEPSALDDPMVDAADLLPPGTAVPAAGLAVAITSTEGDAPLPVTDLDWRLVDSASGERLALEVRVAAPGGFELHRLAIDDPRVDPFFARTLFSFKQACEQRFDCREPCPAEPPESVDVPIDYLARDFWSLRRALLDFAAGRYPRWAEPLAADQAVMLMEIMAAQGDELAYQQDRIAREASLPTATERRSRSALARLVDYLPDPGHAATTELALEVDAGGHETPEGARVWALPEGRPPVTFMVDAPAWHHAAWNEIPLHLPDSAERCLPAGATETHLVTASPTAAELPPGTTLGPTEYWVGRRMILRARPADPGEPERAFAITLTGVEHGIDELVDPPVPFARVRWAEPLPWPLPLADTVALGNLALARAGDEVVEHFRIGPDAAIEARFPGLDETDRRRILAFPRAVEREGPYLVERGARGRILRYGLRAAETVGLGWRGERDPLGIGSASAQAPLLTLTEVLPPVLDAGPGAPPVLDPDPAAPAWVFHRDLLASDLDTPAFTLEEGTWREVVTHRTPFEDVVFQDYAGDAGWSLRFGDGAFGRPPENGTILEVRYRAAPGRAANLAPDSVTALAPPIGPAPGPAIAHVLAVTNPLPIASGRDEVDAETVRIDAPEAFRALPLRAVRAEDYASILERLDDVERAHATTRWTGSWSTDFVAADPRGGFALAPEQARRLRRVVECVRQAGRDARVRAPDYVDIDLEIEICVRPEAYAGEVVPRVERALAAPGFFAPDRFTFGQPLHRSALEAAIQDVPGVKAVEAMRVRVRRRRDWKPFDMPALAVEPEQIIRLQHDPRFPGRGSLRVEARGGAS